MAGPVKALFAFAWLRYWGQAVSIESDLRWSISVENTLSLTRDLLCQKRMQARGIVRADTYLASLAFTFEPDVNAVEPPEVPGPSAAGAHVYSPAVKDGRLRHLDAFDIRVMNPSFEQ